VKRLEPAREMKDQPFDWRETDDLASKSGMA
jgi:hypothetical protein